MVYYYGMINGNDRDARLLTILLETGVKGLKAILCELHGV
jgi:hypothetical protein